MDYFLKAADEAELHSALVAAGILIPAKVPVIEIIDGVPTQSGEVNGFRLADGVALDVIGAIPKPTGNILAVDGVQVPEMTVIEGCHANLIGDLSAEQLAALGDVLLPEPPANPYRVFAPSVLEDPRVQT